MNDRFPLMQVNQNSSIRDTMEAIELSSTGTAFIVDGSGRFVGLVTDGDIRRAILKGVNLGISIRTIMTVNPITLKCGYDPIEVYRMMLDKQILCAPVLDSDRRIAELVHLPELLTRLPDCRQTQLESRNGGKILIIGGAGYIGSVLVRVLLQRGHKVKVYDSLLYGDDSLQGLDDTENYEFIQGDIRDVESLLRALDQVSSVVHLGEIVGDPACQVNSDFTIEVNYSATRKLAETCRNLGVRRFIFASSCSVYGQGEGVFDELSALNPVSLYGKCKIEAEHAVLGLVSPDFAPTVLRFATVFGISHRPRFDLVVNLMSAQATVERCITIMGGEQRRPFVHVHDLAEVIANVLTAPVELVFGQIFNVGSNEGNYRLREVGSVIAEEIPGVHINTERDKVDCRDYCVSFNKVRMLLGNMRFRTVRQGVREINRAITEKKIGDYRDLKYSNYQNFTR